MISHIVLYHYAADRGIGRDNHRDGSGEEHFVQKILQMH